jgi:hypothetical protein
MQKMGVRTVADLVRLSEHSVTTSVPSPIAQPS